MSIQDAVLLLNLKQRVEALEAAQAANRKPLVDHNAAMQAAGEALYCEVKAILAAHQGSFRLTAKHVLPKLTRNPLPSIRLIQHLLKRARAELAALRP